MRRSLLVLLLLAAVIVSGCGKPKQEEAKTEESKEIAATAVESEAPSLQEKYELPGEYAIDLGKLGMALTFYLRIDEENNFLLSANRSFSDDRGSGVIGELEGTYMMIYADSTPDRTKTATFERVGHNLLFQSTLPPTVQPIFSLNWRMKMTPPALCTGSWLTNLSMKSITIPILVSVKKMESSMLILCKQGLGPDIPSAAASRAQTACLRLSRMAF